MTDFHDYQYNCFCYKVQRSVWETLVKEKAMCVKILTLTVQTAGVRVNRVIYQRMITTVVRDQYVTGLVFG